MAISLHHGIRGLWDQACGLINDNFLKIQNAINQLPPTPDHLDPRVSEINSSSTPLFDLDLYDIAHIDRLATNILGVTVVGTPVDGRTIAFHITDNGTARTIAWGSSFAATAVPLPITTVANQRLVVVFVYDERTLTWDCVLATGSASGDGVVRVVPYLPGSTSIGRVFAPDGSEITTAGTTTSGLQEAFNYAHTNGFDCHVYGGPGYIYAVTSGSGLSIPVLEESSHWIIDASVNFQGTAADTTTCVTFDTMESSKFEWNGRIITPHRTGKVVLFYPRTGLISSGSIVDNDSDVYLAQIVGAGAASLITFDFSATNCVGFLNMRLWGNELNGGTIATISVPTIIAGRNFFTNQIAFSNIHGMVGAAWGVQLGTGTSAGGAGACVWDINITGSGTNQGFRTYFSGDIVRGLIRTIGGTTALQLEADAASNQFCLTTITGTVVDGATTKTNQVVTGNTHALINPLISAAEAWIGPSATAGIYFKSGNIGIGMTPTALLSIGNSAGAQQFQVTGTASAVNFLTTSGSIAGGRLNLSATGTDTNIQVSINAKGSGSVGLSSNNHFVLTVNGVASGVNRFDLTSSAAGNPILLASIGNDTNIPFRINPKGTGGVGIGITPTAILHLKAGTATASTAPVKFTSGTLLTAAEAGAVEFLTDAFYGTITTGPTRGVFALSLSGRSTAQTAAVASVLAYTLPAADASFLVSANVLVTTATLHSFNVTVAYTDEGNTARTLTLNFSTLAGVISNAAITNAAGAVPYEGVAAHIRCKASTTITIATVGSFTTVVYNVEARLTRVA